jgi:hypothetical protein
MTMTTDNRREKRASVATAGRYWLPTRPYTLVDAINRAAAATGSVRYAMLAADADYSGHHVTVTYNDYRDYCICEHYWGGRVVQAAPQKGPVPQNPNAFPKTPANLR